MLSVTVYLDRYIIIIIPCIAVAGLHRTADSHIDRQIQYFIPFPLTYHLSPVCGTVVDNDIVILRKISY